MMGRLFIGCTAAFWLAVTAFWGASLWFPAQPDAGHVEAATAAPVEKALTPAEVGRHDKPGDCWMIIAGAVYDLSAYLPQHPSDPAIVNPWCGKEATQAYRTKTKGRPHSPYADQLLEKYRIGKLREAR